jgi:hypothetical protein
MIKTIRNIRLSTCSRRATIESSSVSDLGPYAGEKRLKLNRHQRLSVKAKVKTSNIKRVVAIHEAGHAVARYLVAEDLGRTTDEAISYIDVSPESPVDQSIDGTMSLHLQATTYGPMLSTEIQEIAMRDFADMMQSNKMTMEHVAAAIVTARSEGADISKWLRARMLIAVFGAAAEAKYSGRLFAEVWGNYETESDLNYAVHDCFLAGVTDDHAIHASIDEAMITAAVLIERSEVWRAIVALADSLPAFGKFEGKNAVAIIRSAMTGPV